MRAPLLQERTLLTSPGGSGVSVPTGPAQSHTFTSDDMAASGSWYGATPVYVWGTWTPEASGTLVLLPPADADGSFFDIFVWRGDVANTDFPDATTGSGSFGQSGWGIDAYVFSGPIEPPIMEVQAGQAYTVILVDWSGVPGKVLNLDGLLNSLGPFGDIGLVPPPPPADALVDVAQGPAGLRYAPRQPSARLWREINPRAYSGLLGLNHLDNGPTGDGIQTVLGPMDLDLAFLLTLHDDGTLIQDPLQVQKLINPQNVLTIFGVNESVCYINLLAPGGHLGPSLLAPALLYGRQCHIEWGAFRLDGSAAFYVFGDKHFASGETQDQSSEYNVDFLNWSTAATDGTDLVLGTANANTAKTLAGGLIAVFALVWGYKA